MPCYTNRMKKIIFGIFAHPDDEAFGPAGTLLQEARSGTDVHLILLTPGDAGVNTDNAADLGEVRLAEWRAAGQMIGAKDMYFLGYEDGELNNASMQAIAGQVGEIVSNALADAPAETTVEFMSFDFTGLSGHIDHIVAARAACLAFYRLKETDARLARIRLMCLPETLFPNHRTDWIYAEKGRVEHEIDEIVDARDLREAITKIMRVHKTQAADCDQLLALLGDQLGLNHFVVKT